MNKYDFLIVGAGLFGSVFAYEAAKRGKKVLIIDERNHIGGNCYTESYKGINIHKYGPHIFHTNHIEVWDFIRQFADFNNYTHRVKANYENQIYTLPINLMTFHQLWGITTPPEAIKKLEEVRVKIVNPANFEENALSKFGVEIYDKLLYGYTKKQWGREPVNLPASIIDRMTVRLNFNDDYYTHPYQGIPIGGYTQIFEKLLANVEIKTKCDYCDNKKDFENIADMIIYTGTIDQYYDYCYGALEYRSLEFSHIKDFPISDSQGVAQMNYTSTDVSFTRIIEHKHFEFLDTPHNVITYEYPTTEGSPYYPINDNPNNTLYLKYQQIENPNVYFCGRLGSYKYLDMHEVIYKALEDAARLI